MTRNRHIKAALIMLAMSLSILLSSHAYSTTYYIDYASGDDIRNDGLSTSYPWKRSPGMAGFSGSYYHTAGDKFVFKGGVIWPSAALWLTIKYSGDSGNPDIYAGGQRESTPWGTGYPVFDGGAVNGMLAIHSSGNSHITIDGIKIVNVGYTDGSGQAIFFGGGSGITVKNCWLQPNGVNAFAYGAYSGSYSKVYFHDNIIRQAGRIHVSVGDATCDDFQFYNNTMYGGVDYNPVRYHCDGFMIGADGVGSWKATNLKIYNNKFLGDWRRGATAQIYLNGTPGLYGWKYVSIYNNLLVTEHNTGGAFSPGAMVISAGHSDVKVYNNTIDARSNTAKPMSHCIFFGTSNNNIDVKNNILAGCDNGITIAANTTGTVTVDNNLYSTLYGNHLIWDARPSVNTRCNTIAGCQATPVFQEAHGITGEPKFVALPSGGVVGSGDWRLQSNSPAVSNGSNLSDFFTTDILGNLRGKKWDIGAYEK